MNDAFIEILGYPAEGLPYRWPHPWLVDKKTAREQQSLVAQQRQRPVRDPDPASRRPSRVGDGEHQRGQGDRHDRDVYVGTIRDITAERAFAARESAVLRLATAVAWPRAWPRYCRSPSTSAGRRSTSNAWSRSLAGGDGEPTVQVAGEPSESSWRGLDPWLRDDIPGRAPSVAADRQDGRAARQSRQGAGIGRGAVRAGDLALWLELRSPAGSAPRIGSWSRCSSATSVWPCSMCVSSRAARETSLTLQRAMLPPVRAAARLRRVLRTRGPAIGNRGRLV